MLAITPALRAQVSTRVCLADGNTPLELADPCIPFVYRPIMVGTHLTIIISSDIGEDYWGGGLYISDPWRDNGELFGRDPDGGSPCDWKGSHLEAAGPEATVWDLQDSFMSGFELATDVENIMPGDWFIIDYNATNVGDCNVGFYDYAISGDPIYNLSFIHVSSRDFDDDGIVNFEDFAVFGSNWQRNDCTKPQNCSGADLDADGYVGISDLKLFAEYWLEKTR